MILDYIAGAATVFDNYFYAANYALSEASVWEWVKLLKELENKAMESVVNSFVFDSNELTGAVVMTNRNPYVNRFDIHMSFKLNGKEYRFVKQIEESALKMSKREAYRILVEKASSVIAENILAENVSKNGFLMK